MSGLQQLGFVSVWLFWINFPMCYCSKSAWEGQGLPEKNPEENQRGLGRLPYEKSIMRTAGEHDGFLPVCPDTGSACYESSLSFKCLSFIAELHLILPDSAKGNLCNLKKAATPLNPRVALAGQPLSALFFKFCYFPCQGSDQLYSLIAHAVKERIKLPPVCAFPCGLV